MPVTAAPKALAAGAFTVSDLRQALVTCGAPTSKAERDNPKLLKSTFDLLRAVVDNKSMTGVSAIASGTNSASKMLHANKALQRGTQATSFALGELNHKMDFVNKVAKLTSVGAAGVFVGASVVEKTGLAISILDADHERAWCVGALMELGGSAAVSMMKAPTEVFLANARVIEMNAHASATTTH